MLDFAKKMFNSTASSSSNDANSNTIAEKPPTERDVLQKMEDMTVSVIATTTTPITAAKPASGGESVKFSHQGGLTYGTRIDCPLGVRKLMSSLKTPILQILRQSMMNSRTNILHVQISAQRSTDHFPKSLSHKVYKHQIQQLHVQKYSLLCSMHCHQATSTE